MLAERAQIATEYLIITIFLLAIITITFAYSFINYNQNVMITQANNAIDSLINKADYVYSLGPENSQFTWITIPIGTQKTDGIYITHKCISDESQGPTCPLGDADIQFSAINLTINLIGGPATLTWPSKSPLQLVNDAQDKPFPCATANAEFCDGTYKILVCWNSSSGSNICNPAGMPAAAICPDEKICLRKV